MNIDNEDKELSYQLDLLDASLGGSRGPDQQRIAVEGLLWVTTILRKNKDYGSSVWQRPTLAPECTADVAIRVRMSDKISRLATLYCSHETAEVDESIEDTIRDLGAYCLLWSAMPTRG